MAKKKKITESKGLVPSKALKRKTWETVPLDFVQNLFQVQYPSHRIDKAGKIIRMQCPFHDNDTRPSFNIDFAKHSATCYSANCSYYETDLVAICAKGNRVPYTEMAFQFYEKFNLKVIDKEKIPELEAQEEALRLHDLFLEVSTKCLSTAIRVLAMDPSDIKTTNETERANQLAEMQQQMKDFEFVRPAIEYLRKVRNFELMPELFEIGVVPTEKVISQLVDIDMATRKKLIEMMEPVRDIKYPGNLTFAYRSSLSRVNYFKVRVIKDLQGNFIELEDRKNKEFITLYHKKAKDFVKQSAFLGLPFYRHELKTADTVYLVEGDFDEISWVARQLSNALPRDIFLATGGNSSGCDLSALDREMNIRYVRLVYDAPEKNGDLMCQRVIESNAGSLSISVFNWKGCIGYDLDEIANRSTDFVSDYYHVTSEENYYTEEEFMILQIAKKVDAIGKTSDKVKIYTIIKYLNHIKDPILLRSLVPHMASRYNLDPEILKTKLPPVTTDDETFLLRALHAFQKSFRPVGMILSPGGNDKQLVLWNIAKKCEVRVSTSKMKEAKSVLSSEMGSLYDWFKETTGILPSISYIDDEQTRERRIPDIETELTKYLQQIITKSGLGMPELNEERKYQGGCYYLPNLQENGKKYWYLKNGVHLFKGAYDEDGAAFRWKRSEYPVIDGHYFDIAETIDMDVWSDYAINEENLNNPPLNLSQCFVWLTDILRRCFSYVHDCDYELIAALCIYYSVYQCFDRRVFLFVMGETSSGKSRMIESVFGGKLSKLLYFVESFCNMSHYTEAGMRQTATLMAHAVSLDEFEDSGLYNDEKSKVVRMILQAIRTAESGTKIHKGTPSGKVRTYSIDYPIVAAGIRPPSDTVDRNRFITVTTQKDPKKPDPIDEVLNVRPAEELVMLRHAITSIGFHYTREFKEYSKELKKYLGLTKNPLLKTITSRTSSQLVPPSTVMGIVQAEARFLNENPESHPVHYDKRQLKPILQDAVDYLEIYAKDHESELMSVADMGETPKLWSQFFRSNRFRLVQSESNTLERRYNLVDILQDQELREQMRDTPNQGVKIYETDEKDFNARSYFLIISWEEARTLFPPRSEYKNHSVNKIKEMAERDQNVVRNPDDIKRVIPKWKYELRQNLDFGSITVRDVTAFVKEGRAGCGPQQVLHDGSAQIKNAMDNMNNEADLLPHDTEM